MARPTLMAMPGRCPDAHRECDMQPHPERSLLASVAGCLLVSFAVVVLTTTAAFAAQKTPKGAADNGRAATAASMTGHPNSSNANSASDHSAGNAATVGDPSQPQPLSGADQNAGGANGQCPGGPYCSTRDGSPSGNGNGNGKATGKPCAGCVGKADNKNPQGQMPDGSDNNAGYECDRNHGIGRTNPAHTGCQSSPPPPCEETETCPPPPCEQTETCPPPPCDEATEDCGNPPPSACVPTAANNFCSEVQGEKVVRTPAGAVAGESASQTPAATTLPFTGADIGILFAAALPALIAGSALLLIVRRRRT